jgi:hypothetical protein
MYILNGYFLLFFLFSLNGNFCVIIATTRFAEHPTTRFAEPSFVKKKTFSYPQYAHKMIAQISPGLKLGANSKKTFLSVLLFLCEHEV